MNQDFFYHLIRISGVQINFPNTSFHFPPSNTLMNLIYSSFTRGGMSWHLYTPVGPLKNHPTGAFYSSNGSSRHQSLKDKCASSLALTPGGSVVDSSCTILPPPQMLHNSFQVPSFHPPGREISGIFFFIAPNSRPEIHPPRSSIRSRGPVAKLLSTSRSNVRAAKENESRFQPKNSFSLLEEAKNITRYNSEIIKKHHLPLKILYKKQNPTTLPFSYLPMIIKNGEDQWQLSSKWFANGGAKKARDPRRKNRLLATAVYSNNGIT